MLKTIEMLSRVHVFVSGRVQGVAYRYFVERRAAEIPVTGWVRNLRDGRVEIMAEGEKADLESFLGVSAPRTPHGQGG